MRFVRFTLAHGFVFSPVKFFNVPMNGTGQARGRQLINEAEKSNVISSRLCQKDFKGKRNERMLSGE